MIRYFAFKSNLSASLLRHLTEDVAAYQAFQLSSKSEQMDADGSSEGACIFLTLLDLNDAALITTH